MVLETGGSSTVKLAQLLAQGEQPVRRIPPGGCHDVITTTKLSSGHALPGNPTTRRDSHFGPRGEGSPSRRGQRCGVARPQLERAGQASRSASPTTPDGGTGCGGCPAGDSGPQVERHAVVPVGAGHVPGDLGEPLAADAGADRVAVDVLGGPADVVGTQEQAAFEDEAAGVPGDRQPVEERLQRVPGQDSSVDADSPSCRACALARRCSSLKTCRPVLVPGRSGPRRRQRCGSWGSLDQVSAVSA